VRYVVGADEVGLGPLAGDLYVCAVMVPEDGRTIEGVTDSKALSPADRERLRKELIAHPNLHYEITRATPKEIDEEGIRVCHVRCYVQAITRVLKNLKRFDSVDSIKVDGGHMELGLRLPHEFVVKGDAKIWEIGAASIIAKVERDAYMAEMALEYPGYGWARNVGYGTPEHRKMMIQRGLTPLHRESFCRKILKKAEPEGIDVFDLFPPDDP